MAVTMCVGLYTSRVVLSALGISDYGLYNVVGGIVVIFTSINTTLAAGTQRFLSYELGENENQKTKLVFSTSLVLHIVVAAFVLLCSETAGLWFLLNKMNIAPERMTAAMYVYQFSVISVVVGIVQVPFVSSVIAREKMNIYAYLSIYEAFMKLIIAFLIQHYFTDKLIAYAALILFIQVSSALVYNVYCQKHFEECRFSLVCDKKIFKNMLGFSGWNFVGCAALTLQRQGVDVLLNLFCGTLINAARGISFQVNGIVSSFVNNIQVAINPQVVKLYAAGELEQMKMLVFTGARLMTSVMLLIAIPIYINIDYILQLWLKEVPDYTSVFLRIILIQTLVTTAGKAIVMVNHAVGRMKVTCSLSGGVLLLIVPVSYILLKYGFSPSFVLCINIIPWILETLILLCLLKRYINFPIWEFYKEVYLRVICISASAVIPYIVYISLNVSDFYRFLIVTGLSLVTTSAAVFYIGLSHGMQKMVVQKIKAMLSYLVRH
jgi:Na+-driven multidrug efflux pump